MPNSHPIPGLASRDAKGRDRFFSILVKLYGKTIAACGTSKTKLLTRISDDFKSIPSATSTSQISDDTTSTSEIKPKTHRALVVAKKGEYEVRDDFPMPFVGEDDVMINCKYVGLNPIDWKSVEYNFCIVAFPWVTGREMSGTVVRVGNAVTGFKAGDKVWTSTYYKDVRAGCFQENVVVPSHTVLRVPNNLSMESAACLGVAALTAGMTLWKWLEIPLPSTINSSDSEGDWLLIWGGSTVTGQFATQLACLSGWKVITVNSSLTKSLSESLGAAHVVVRDGKSESELLEEIQTVTNGGITRAIDLVSPKTAAIGLQAVSQGKPAHFAPLALMASSQVVPENVTAHTVEMKQFVLNRDNKFYAEEINRIIATGKLIIPEIVSLDGGLEGVPAGLDTLKKGNMGGKKLVSRIR
ncbi:hypothetical protein S40293_08907 [Stachybotrys chartarum IBT 40293]|nr:hypothetical protein S40293_08907 [Stachybotrys chartarum IBT 40293]